MVGGVKAYYAVLLALVLVLVLGVGCGGGKEEEEKAAKAKVAAAEDKIVAPESNGPLVDKLVGKKIIFTDKASNTLINTNQPPKRIAFSFKQDGHIQVDKIPPPRVEVAEYIEGDGESYVMDGLDVKVWRIDGRQLEMMTLFSFPKSNITKGDKVRSPKLPMGNERQELKMVGGLIKQSTNVWVYAIEPANGGTSIGPGHNHEPDQHAHSHSHHDHYQPPPLLKLLPPIGPAGFVLMGVMGDYYLSRYDHGGYGHDHDPANDEMEGGDNEESKGWVSDRSNPNNVKIESALEFLRDTRRRSHEAGFGEGDATASSRK